MDSESRRAAAADALDGHRRLLRSGRDGRILSGLMLPFVKRSTPSGLGVLTTIGRKTGKPRSKCIRVVREGSTAYLVGLRPPHVAIAQPDAVQAWVLNIRANPNVTLQLPGGTFTGIATEITDSRNLARARAAICDPVYPSDYGECALHLRGLPSRKKIQALHQYWFDTGIPLEVELDAT